MDVGTLFFYISLALLAVAFVVQLWWRQRALLAARPLFFVSVLATIAYAVYTSYWQYQAFASGPLGLTLGTLDGVLWFIGYTRLHFWNTYLVSLIAALLVICIAQYLNKKRGYVHFEADELYLVATGIFLAGYPGFFFFVPSVLIASAIASALFVRRGERLPLYYFWMPGAIVTLTAIQFWAVNQPWWASFRF